MLASMSLHLHVPLKLEREDTAKDITPFAVSKFASVWEPFIKRISNRGFFVQIEQNTKTVSNTIPQNFRPPTAPINNPLPSAYGLTPTALRTFAKIGEAMARAFSAPVSSILSNSSVLSIKAL